MSPLVSSSSNNGNSFDTVVGLLELTQWPREHAMWRAGADHRDCRAQRAAASSPLHCLLWHLGASRWWKRRSAAKAAPHSFPGSWKISHVEWQQSKKKLHGDISYCNIQNLFYMAKQPFSTLHSSFRSITHYFTVNFTRVTKTFLRSYLHGFTSYCNRQPPSWWNIHLFFLSPYSRGMDGVI